MVSNEATLRAALSEVSRRVAELQGLDPVMDPGSDESMYRVMAALDALLASIAAAERAGAPGAALDAALAPARAVLAKGDFYRRTHTWPRGYPGDFETVEMLCDPQRFATEKRSVADWAQEITLASPSVQQHRNKIMKQALLVLEKAIEATADTRILSAACGGCPDLRLILPLLRSFPGRFVLVDSDEDALAFSRNQLGTLANSCDFVRLNATRYLKHAAREGMTFDLVYAGGLFDYFDDDKVAFFVATAHGLLKPGGRLFFTNVSEANHHLTLIRQLARWHLILRSEEGILEICRRANIDPGSIQIERDATGITLLVDIHKPRDPAETMPRPRPRSPGALGAVGPARRQAAAHERAMRDPEPPRPSRYSGSCARNGENHTRRFSTTRGAQASRPPPRAEPERAGPPGGLPRA